MAERIDRAWLRARGGTVLEMHLNMGDQHRLCRRIVDRERGRPIGLSFTDVSYKRTRRNGIKGGTCERTWHVDTHPEPIADLDEALEILAIVRTGNAEGHHAG